MPELLKHQIEGVERIRKQGSLLIGDEPGVGKTAQMIVATREYQKVLILTLASLKYQMRGELKKWGVPEDDIVVIDGDKTARAALWQQKRRFYVANYELLLRDALFLTAIPWDYIVADEATRLSNVKNKQYKALRVLRSQFRLPMTGTPVSNRPDDLWGILNWAVPGCLGNYWSFMQRYCIKTTQGWIVGYRNLDELAKRIAPFMLRRLKTDVLDLPEKIVSTVPFPLSDKERRLYDKIKTGLLLEIEAKEISKVEHISSLDSTIVQFGKLCELCDSMELLGEGTISSKLDVLKDVLATLNGSKAIIFTRFSRMADIIERELGCWKITGDTSLKVRDCIVKAYNNPGEVVITDEGFKVRPPTTISATYWGEHFQITNPKVLVMTNAGEYGLNLQAANAIIHFDQPMSNAKLEQRNGRAHRFGQTKSVLIYNLVAEKTVDEAMLKRIEKKQDMSRLLLSDIKEMVQ